VRPSPTSTWAPLAVRYARPFFDLQVEFAKAASAVSGLSLAQALLDSTNLYVRFGAGRQFDPLHPTWQAYLAGLRDADDSGKWTYHFYLGCPPAPPPPGVVATFGCFSYARLGDDRVRLHFHDAEGSGRSALGHDRRDRRLTELRALFADLERVAPASVRVVGASWLYNVEAYRRLFPAAYLATARVRHGRFRHMPLWGQFLDRQGGLRRSAADEFRARLARVTEPADLSGCFPLQVLGLEAPARAFFAFYGV